MIDFLEIHLNDAVITDIRISLGTVEVDYLDWAENPCSLVFVNAISCFDVSSLGKSLSHGEVESEGRYLSECCEDAEEDSVAGFFVFNFISTWSERKILRIVAEGVELRG